MPISVRALPLRNKEGKIVGAVEVFSDAPRRSTEQRVNELEQLAFRDALTVSSAACAEASKPVSVYAGSKNPSANNQGTLADGGQTPPPGEPL